jgi:hypothetical protein
MNRPSFPSFLPGPAPATRDMGDIGDMGDERPLPVRRHATGSTPSRYDRQQLGRCCR